MNRRSAVIISFWAGMLFFAVGLLTFSGELTSPKMQAAFIVGSNLARSGQADIGPLLWSDTPGIWEADSYYPADRSIISSMVMPFMWLGYRIPGLNALHFGLLGGVIGVSLGAGLFSYWLLKRGLFAWRWGLGTALIGWAAMNLAPAPPIWFAGSGPLNIQPHLLLPGLILLVLSAVNLAGSAQPEPSRMMSPLWGLALVVLLTAQMMLGSSHLALNDDQSQADLALSDTLATSARPGDVLLVPMPADGDVASFSTWQAAYQRQSLPTFIWIERGPEAIDSEGRDQILRTALTGKAGRILLFERWLSPGDPTGPTARTLGRHAFPLAETWLAQSGKVTSYALPIVEPAMVAVNVPFEAGFALRDFGLANQGLLSGDALRLRLTWQATADASPQSGIVGFAHLLDQSGRSVAQQDRLLFDLSAATQSPLLPGQTVVQGYGLQLPDALAPGDYSLVVGLYNAANGQRLFRADDSPDDFLYLTTVGIREK